MIKLLTSIKELHKLQDIALAHVADKTLWEASVLSSQLNINVYIYNYPEHREIKREIFNKFCKEGKIKTLVTKDNRIAVEGTIYLSIVLSKDQALTWFEYFHRQIGLPIY